MLKNFLFKKMLERQMKDIPEDQKNQVLDMISKNPDFFKKISEEIQNEMASGKDQMSAIMVVMENNKEEAMRIFKK